MATMTAELVVRLIDRVTAPARGLTATVNRLEAAQRRNTERISQARGAMWGAAAAAFGLKKALEAPIRAAMDLQSAMADVRKVVNFATPKEFADFTKMIQQMSTEVPIAADGLAQIAAAAGQAGIPRDELKAWTEFVAKVGVAFDMTTDEVGSDMAKIRTSLNLTTNSTSSLADAINYLSNNMASKGSEIVDVMKRVGAQATSQLGLSAEQTAALGSAMIAAGAESNVAATSLRNMGYALTAGEAATTKQAHAFLQLGLTATDVAKRMQKDAIGTIEDVFQRINKLPVEQQSSVMTEIFGKEARALPPLVTNVKLLHQALGLVGDQTKYAGSATQEYLVRSQTFANKLQLFQNQMSRLAVSVGNALLPVLTGVMQNLVPIVDAVTHLSERFPRLTATAVSLTAGFIGLRIATLGLRWAFLFTRGGAIIAAVSLTRLANAVATVAANGRELTALNSSLAAMNGARYGGIARLVDFLKGMALAVPGIGALSSALGAIGGVLAGISAPVWGTVAAVVAGIAAAGFVVWKYWDRISATFSGVARRIGEELTPALSALQPVLGPIGDLAHGIGAGFAWAGEQVQAFTGWIGQFLGRETLTESQKANFEKSGYDFADRFINAIESRVMGLVNWFRDLPTRIAKAIGSIDIGSLIHWPSPPGWLSRLWGGGQAPQPAHPGVSGARAAGGAVVGGRTYLVGERGPELYTADSGGSITSNADLMKLIGQGRGGPVTIQAPMGPFHIYNMADVDAVIQRIGDRLREEMAGIQADLEWSKG